MMLLKNDCVHTKSIQTLLTSGIVCCMEEDDPLCIEEYIACLETKLTNRNCAALKFVAEDCNYGPYAGVTQVPWRT